MRYAKRLLLMGVSFLAPGAFAQSSWVNLGPHGGLIDAVVADYTSPGTLVAGTQTGDFYRSNNDGQSWSYLGTLPQTADRAIQRLVIDTADGQHLYAATSRQLFFSIDGGGSWTASANDEVDDVFDLYISPVNGSQLYAAASDKIWRSLNQGLSWSAVYEAEDSVEITAFAFDPRDPQSFFFVGWQTDNGLGQILFTDNGGTVLNLSLTLPLDWVVAKLFISSDPSGAVMALVGSADSTKIIRNSGGSGWNTVYASPEPLYIDGIRYSFFNWIPRRSDYREQILNTQSSLLKTSNNGAMWTKLAYPDPVSITTLARSPADTSKFYGRAIGGNGLSKIILSAQGGLSFTDINFGLTATQVTDVLYANSEDLIVRTSTNEILLSQNGGFDFNRFQLLGGVASAAAYKSEVDDSFFWITDDGSIFRSANGITASLWNTVPFPGVFDRVVSAASLSHYDADTDSDSLLVVAAVGQDGTPGGAILMSVDDGANWQNITFGGPFGTSAPTRVTLDDAYPLVSIYAGTDQAIYRTVYRGVPTWTSVYNAPPGFTIEKFSSRFGGILFVLSRDPDGVQQLDAVFQDSPGQWEAYDITYTLDQIDPPRHGYAVDVHVGDDASYLNYDMNDGTRKIFKASFFLTTWHEVSSSPLDQLMVHKVLDDNDYEDQSFILYAAADNGIWRLRQIASLSHDTLASSPPTSVNLQDTSYFDVTYTNSGTAVAIVDSFRITDDVNGEFGFADPLLGQLEFGFPLDLLSSTPVTIFYAPGGLAFSQATLTAYYRGKSSRGLDSVFSLSTRLVGNPRASRIQTGLKGDSLELGGALLYNVKTTTLTLTNNGADTLHVYGLFFAEGSHFSLDEPDDITVNGEALVAPGQSLPVPVHFRPTSAGGFVDHIGILSSAHNFFANEPDSLRVITVVGTGAAIDILNLANLRPQLGQNQGMTIQLGLAQLTTSEVTARLYYRKVGTQAAGFQSVPFSPAAGGGTGIAIFNATVPSDDITENGLEFYVEASGTGPGSVTLYFPNIGGGDSTYQLPITVPRPGLSSSGSLSLPGGTGGSAFQLVSFPIVLNNATPQGAFGESNLGQIGDDGDWQLYRYNDADDDWIRATDGDVTFGNIESGKAYLLITRKPKTLNSGPGKTANPATAFVTINPGWNMIANPYAFGIRWLDVALFNDRVEYAEIVTLRNGKFRYVEDFELSELILEPWKGYMYYSSPDSGTYDLYYPAIAAGSLLKNSGAPRRAVVNGSLRDGEYVLSLQLTQDREVITHHVGELEDARESLDDYDRPRLPVLGPGDAFVSFIGNGNDLNSDFRPLSGEGHYWDFTLRTGGPSATAQLSVQGLETIPEGYELLWLDRDRNVALDPLSVNVTVSGKPHVYRLFVGTADFIERTRAQTVPTSYYLGTNFPNPFNPTTVIRYGLPTASRVELAVYNMLGQKVRTLVRGQEAAAAHSVAWDGRNDAGRSVASGVYVYRLHAEAIDGSGLFTRTRKMTLLR